jgi:uncharacterized pyridoxamine 5'-phosphate oxidase family protein
MEGEFLEANDLSGFVPALESLPDGVLANLNGGSIRTQIVTFQFAEGRRMYFCTNGAKPLFRQLQQDPHVSYCVYKPGEDLVVSINGDVVFEDDPAIKARLWNGSANLRRFYRGVDDPNMRPFYINADEVETFSSAGVKIYRLK